MSEKTASKSKPDKSDSDAGASKANGESGKSDGGKPARESVGGAKEVHYGYFSNVRTAEYRDGWDAIWGQGKSRRSQPSTAAKRNTRRRPTTPIRLNLDIDDLPDDLRAGLAEVARAKLKKSRVNYDKRNQAGAVDWQIECRVKRF